MSLSHARITDSAMQTLRGHGFKPDDVPFGNTGKSAVELIVSAVSQALVDEIKANAEVSVALTKGLAQWIGDPTVIPVPQDGGASIKAALQSLSSDGSFDKSEGKIS